MTTLKEIADHFLAQGASKQEVMAAIYGTARKLGLPPDAAKAVTWDMYVRLQVEANPANQAEADKLTRSPSGAFTL